MSGYSYACFQADDAYFLYDAMRNAVVEIPAEVYAIVDESVAGDLGNDRITKGRRKSTIAFLDRMRGQYGLLNPIHATFDLPDKEALRKDLGSQLDRLTLGVTEQCNHRCTYCCYSGHFPAIRTHGKAHMPWNLIENSIDFFFARTPPATAKSEALPTAPSVGFYGGEPTLHWNLLTRAIDKIRQTPETSTYTIGLTTNGALVNSRRIDYLVDKDVCLYISLDGPETVHDVNRILVGGGSSHAEAVRVLADIQKRHSAYMNRVMINCTFDMRNDFLEVAHFFNTGGRASWKVVNNSLSYHGVNYFNPGNDLRARHARNLDRYIEDYFDALKNPDHLFNFSLFRSSFSRIFEDLAKRRIEAPVEGRLPGGICIPGLSKLFINSTGSFYACQNLEYPGFDIGSLMHGFDVDKIYGLLEWFIHFAEVHCTQCWAFRLCQLCFLDTFADGRMGENNLAANCKRQRRKLLNDLRLFAVIWRREEREKLTRHRESLHARVQAARSVP